MSYTTKLIKKAQQTTTAWSGGTTTQIAIYPEAGDYSKRDFLWRLSTAVVDLEQSTFTSLPGVARILMVLAGQVRLEHQEHHTAHLTPYEQDCFLGDWQTTCFGKASDLNLMLKDGCKGSLLPLLLKPGQQYLMDGTREDKGSAGTVAFYCVDGVCTIENGSQFLLSAGDVLLAESDGLMPQPVFTAINLGQQPLHLVIAHITHNNR